MNVLSLFSGIGGIDLGLQRAGMTIVGQCEIEPFCLAVLAKHWPHVWRHTDVKTLTGELVRERCGRIDIIAGGFPCQDISVAGKGAGLDGSRSGLWREMLRVVREVRPVWVLIENVPALRNRGADRVLADLAEADYAGQCFVVGAEHLGAPHRRHRVWIVAHCDSVRESQSGGSQPEQREWTFDSGEIAVAHAQCSQGGPRYEPAMQRRCEREAKQAGMGGVAVADPIGGHGGCGMHEPERGPQGGAFAGWPSGPGQRQHPWEATRLVKFAVGGTVDGLPVRLVRSANRNALKAIGNAVVPQVVEMIGRAIMEAEAA